jgi:hypothetical protein
MSLPAVWPQVLSFFGTPLIIEPSPGQLASDNGLLPLRQLDPRIGLTVFSVPGDRIGTHSQGFQGSRLIVRAGKSLQLVLGVGNLTLGSRSRGPRGRSSAKERLTIHVGPAAGEKSHTYR